MGVVKTFASMTRTLFFRLTLSLIGVLEFGIIFCQAQEVRYGLWVEAEGTYQPFASGKDFENYLKLTSQYSFTDIYCQVYRGGRSWFPSLIADDVPFRRLYQEGIDPLRETLKDARRRGRKVHAWLNALRVTRNFKAPLLEVYGRDAVLIDHEGHSLLEYGADGVSPSGAINLGTAGIWLDASSPEVRRYLLAVVADVLHQYPEIDGIHLDMIRFPIAQKRRAGRLAGFGYSPRMLKGFLKTRGISWEGFQHKQNISRHGLMRIFRRSLGRGEFSLSDWDAYRRAQVTRLVFDVRVLINKLAPNKELSAAVLADGVSAHSYAFQDWSAWTSGGLLDTVIPMAYTPHHNQLTKMALGALEVRGSRSVLVGIGAWLMLNNPQKMIKQVEKSLTLGADGVVLFSYANLFPERGRQALRLIDPMFPAIEKP